MSGKLLRSVLELRTPVSQLPIVFLLPISTRSVNTAAPVVEPAAVLGPRASTPAPRGPPTTPAPRLAPPLTHSVRTLLPLLAAQPAHWASAHIHGRPYLVTAGDSVRLPFKMPGVVPGD